MDVLKLVDLAKLTRVRRMVLGVVNRVEFHASRCHGILVDRTADQIRISLEIELLLLVIQDRCHGTLTDALCTLLLRLLNLLFDPFRVVVLNLLESIKSKNCQVRSSRNENYDDTYVWPLRLIVLAACPVSLSKGSGRYGLSNSMLILSLTCG